MVLDRQRFLRVLMYAERVMEIAPEDGMSVDADEQLMKGTV